MTKTCFCRMRTQRCRSTWASTQSDQRFCCSLPRKYVSSFYIRNFKILASLCLWVIPGHKPRRQVFSWNGSFLIYEAHHEITRLWRWTRYLVKDSDWHASYRCWQVLKLWYTILSMEWIIKTRIRLHRCTSWSASVAHLWHKQVLSWHGPYN